MNVSMSVVLHEEAGGGSHARDGHGRTALMTPSSSPPRQASGQSHHRLPVPAPGGYIEAAILHDAISDEQRQCRLYYIYSDDATVPDIVLESAVIHVDVAEASPPQQSEQESAKAAIRDCRSLQPQVRVHGTETIEAGCRGRPTLHIHGFVKPSQEPLDPSRILHEFERRNHLIRAALS